MPLVSVVIPCYNAGEYIEKCLLALEAQSFSDFEVIAVNDCSTDDTAAVVRRFAETHDLKITCIDNEVNSGPAHSRNRGVGRSDAEYVAFCDSDDWYEPDYLQLMVEAARGNDADMVFCNSQKILPDGRVVKIELISESCRVETAGDALRLGADSLWSILVKRSIVERTPQPDLRNGEDMAVIPLMILKSERFGVVTKPIYNYLCRPGSLSLSANERVVASMEASFDHIVKNQVAGYETEIEFIGVKNVVYGVLLNHFKYSKDRKKARELLARFESRFPRWWKNPYIESLPSYKRLFVRFARLGMLRTVCMMARVHKFLTEKDC